MSQGRHFHVVRLGVTCRTYLVISMVEYSVDRSSRPKGPILFHSRCWGQQRGILLQTGGPILLYNRCRGEERGILLQTGGQKISRFCLLLRTRLLNSQPLTLVLHHFLSDEFLPIDLTFEPQWLLLCCRGSSRSSKDELLLDSFMLEVRHGNTVQQLIATTLMNEHLLLRVVVDVMD